jgi:hypothetical protein
VLWCGGVGRSGHGLRGWVAEGRCSGLPPRSGHQEGSADIMVAWSGGFDERLKKHRTVHYVIVGGFMWFMCLGMPCMSYGIMCVSGGEGVVHECRL